MSAAAAACGTLSLSGGSLLFIRGPFRRQAPGHLLARAQRHQYVGAEGIVRGHLPGSPDQGEVVAIARQTVEVRAVKGGECLEFFQRAGRFEGLRVQLDRGVRREDAGAAAGALLRSRRMRRAVGAQKEARRAGGHGLEQRGPMRLLLEHRQAVVMRPDAADEQRIAIHQQVLRRDGGGDAVACADARTRTAARVVMCSNTMRSCGWRAVQRRQHALNEARLAIKHIDRRIGHFAVHLQHHAELAMCASTPSRRREIGDPGLRVRRGTGRVELHPGDEPARAWRSRSPRARCGR